MKGLGKNKILWNNAALHMASIVLDSQQAEQRLTFYDGF
jgi:hypothetical protein